MIKKYESRTLNSVGNFAPVYFDLVTLIPANTLYNRLIRFFKYPFLNLFSLNKINFDISLFLNNFIAPMLISEAYPYSYISPFLYSKSPPWEDDYPNPPPDGNKKLIFIFSLTKGVRGIFELGKNLSGTKKNEPLLYPFSQKKGGSLCLA